MPNKPSKVFLDLDMLLFEAASAGEKVQYDYLDPTGKVVATFDSAEKSKSWLEEFKSFGVDFEHNCECDPEELTRSDAYYVDKGIEHCYKAFDSKLKALLDDIKIEDWKGYVSAASGIENFRYSIATLFKYKGERGKSHKPIHLEATRKYAVKNPNITAPKIAFEVDDLVNAMALKYGENGMVYAQDKDCQGITGAWFYCPTNYDEPIYSDPSVVGKLELRGDGKVIGWGTLFWLWQCLASDPVDNIKGCNKIGAKKAYKMLLPFSEQPASKLPEALVVVAKAFKKEYGEEYKYNHCYTGEEMVVNWYDVMKENLGLVMMLANQNDSVEKSILKYLDKGEVNESNGESVTDKEVQ